MGYVLRSSNDVNNPTLSGGVYGYFITIGKGIYYRYDGTQTRGIIFIADGGKYGLDKITEFSYKGSPLTPDTEWIFHRGTFPKQIEPVAITNVSGNTFTTDGSHGFSNGDFVRIRSVNGDLPQPLVVAIHGQSGRHEITSATSNTFELDGVSLTSAVS